MIFAGLFFYYRNRLASSTNGTATSTYGYDHTMERVWKTYTNATTTYPNKYYTIATSSSTIVKSIFTPDGELVATVKGTGATTTKEYIHLDHLGGTNIVTNASSTVISTVSYYPYGQERINSGSDATDRHFIGQRTDTETGLSYLQNRYYASNRGQFLNEDQVFWEIGKTPDGRKIMLDPQSANSYGYARDNPIIRKDPDGRGPEMFLAAALAPEIAIPMMIIGTLATYEVMQRNTGGGMWRPFDTSRLYQPPEPPGPVDTGPPNWRPNLPNWAKWVLVGGTVADVVKSYFDKFEETKRTVDSLKQNQTNKSTQIQTTIQNAYSIQGAGQKISATSGGSRLPATVSQGGRTYYRTPDGLLTTTPTNKK